MTISVVIPVYNTERFIRFALDSVVHQTYSDWECICVDDGSTDGSAAILDEYAANDRRFRVVHQANGDSRRSRASSHRAGAGRRARLPPRKRFIAESFRCFAVQAGTKEGVIRA